jgi:hypothetical protein
MEDQELTLEDVEASHTLLYLACNTKKAIQVNNPCLSTQVQCKSQTARKRELGGIYKNGRETHIHILGVDM